MNDYGDVSQLPEFEHDSFYTSDGQFQIVQHSAEFYYLVEQMMGHSAAQYFKNIALNVSFNTEACPGECDRLYMMQEHYERVIRDAADELAGLEVKKADEPKADNLYKTLTAELQGIKAQSHGSLTAGVEAAVKLLESAQRKLVVGDTQYTRDYDAAMKQLKALL